MSSPTSPLVDVLSWSRTVAVALRGDRGSQQEGRALESDAAGVVELRAFRVVEGAAEKWSGSSVALERELQRLAEAHAEAMLGVQFVASEYATGRYCGRIGTLELDETGMPEVVEFADRQRRRCRSSHRRCRLRNVRPRHRSWNRCRVRVVAL